MADTQCRFCGSELREHALYCSQCLVPIALPARRRRPGNVTLCLGVALIFGLPCVWAISGQVRSSLPAIHRTASAAAAPAASAADAAQALIASCGPADRDYSTADSDPPPPIPFRLLTYSSSHLQFDFVPGGNVHLGDPPPYRWALSGVMDTSTNQRITPQQAAQRMSCFDPSLAAPAAAPEQQP